MSWQDREWAKEPPTTPPAAAPGGGWSIVSVLIAVNILIFVGAAWFRRFNEIVYGYGTLVPLAVVTGQVWRLFTAQYLHASTIHVLVNMLALHFLGRPLEDRWSRRKFFIIYTVCGLCGNVFYVILAWRGVIGLLHPAVGASGCIYGLLGIVAVMFPDAEMLLFYVLPVRIRSAAILMGAMAFMAVVERDWNYGGQACHLAGLAFGVWWAVHGEQWWAQTEWAFPWTRERKPPPP